jgi:Fe2+ transport system protein B
MPLTIYTGSNLKKLKKDALISHVVELYGFIDLFNGNTKTIEENEKLKEEVVNIAKIKNKQIQQEKDKYESMCSEQAKSDCARYIQELKEEMEKLQKKYDDSQMEHCNQMIRINDLERKAAKYANGIVELLKENLKLKDIIHKMVMSLSTSCSTFESWICDDQIDPHLVCDNVDECFIKEDGRWRMRKEGE